MLEDGRGRVNLPGLREIGIGHADELLDLVRQAEELRAVGATSANEQSSRSHAILQVVLRERETGRAVGKLSLVDLAGSERAADASSKDRQTRIEGAEINKSRALSARAANPTPAPRAPVGPPAAVSV